MRSPRSSSWTVGLFVIRSGLNRLGYLYSLTCLSYVFFSFLLTEFTPFGQTIPDCTQFSTHNIIYSQAQFKLQRRHDILTGIIDEFCEMFCYPCCSIISLTRTGLAAQSAHSYRHAPIRIISRHVQSL